MFNLFGRNLNSVARESPFLTFLSSSPQSDSYAGKINTNPPSGGRQTSFMGREDLGEKESRIRTFLLSERGGDIIL